MRSPTAEAVFSNYEGLEVSSAGTSIDAENIVSSDLIEWADIIFPMEGIHRKKLNAQFGKLLRTKSVIVLGIPDDYKYMDPELVKILKQRVSQHLPQYDVSDDSR